ncbi:Sec61p translocation complex subunit [Podila epigama]|nr:Sec61p translocation complex subunit [Podila epigama]
MDSEIAQTAIEGPKQFVKDGVAFMNRCTKPDRKEFMQITQAVSMGFLIMGVIGFVVKLIHIPINNILVRPCLSLDPMSASYFTMNHSTQDPNLLYSTDLGWPMMHSYHLPPIFTSQGYHPSILMDLSYQKTSASGASIVQQTTSDFEDQPGLVHVWLCTDSHVLSTSLDPDMDGALEDGYDRMLSNPDIAADPNDNHRAPGRSRSCSLSSSLWSDDSMEWVSCVSSPVSPSITSLQTSQDAPLPSSSAQSTDNSVDSVDDETMTAAGSPEPLMYVLRSYPMRPRIGFRNRCRSMFLSAGNIQEVLFNSRVQLIRAWFKRNVEPLALEHCRNYGLMTEMNHRPLLGSQEPACCPVCYATNTVMKRIVPCGHSLCWTCEYDLNQVSNISCPMCRRLRVVSEFEDQQDMFRATIGLHPRDYVHPLQLDGHIAGSTHQANIARAAHDEDHVHFERLLTDRYRWESSGSFLESLCDIRQNAREYPVFQYFQRHAAQDLCFRSSAEEDLLEYKDGRVLEPPSSGLVLPPHRLYIALIHFCIDMLTLALPSEFQSRRRYRREILLLQLIALFLIPTDEFSPRKEDRIFDMSRWISHGLMIIVRIQRFIRSKARQSMREAAATTAITTTAHRPFEIGQEEAEAMHTNDLGPLEYVSSLPIPRDILYLGLQRWVWIVQALRTLLEWIHIAQMNPSQSRVEAQWQREAVQRLRSRKRPSSAVDGMFGPARKRLCVRFENEEEEEE